MLVQRQPRRVEIRHERRLYLDPKIELLTNGAEPHRGFPHVKAEALFDRYVAGHLLGVSLKGTSSDYTDFERLRDMDEVWALCVRRPKPGWRIFGRFSAKDCFVGLLSFDRVELGMPGNYHKLALETIPAWDNLFPGKMPHRGQAIGDYLGGLWRDIDDE